MKKCILLLSLTAFVFAGEKTTNFKVKGMSCKFGCSTKVKTALEGVDGVKLCDVNFKNIICQSSTVKNCHVKSILVCCSQIF